MDSDDISRPNRLSTQVDYLEQNPDVVAVGCQARFMDENGGLLGPWKFETNDFLVRYDLLTNKTPIVHPGVMMRRDKVVSIGGYDESLMTAQDRDLWWKLAAIGRLANCPETLLDYRRHGQSVTLTKTENQRSVVRQVNLSNLRRLGILDSEAAYEAFQMAARATQRPDAEPPDPESALTYIKTHKRIVKHLRGLGCGPTTIAHIEASAWGQISHWAIRGLRARNWRTWFSVVYLAAPSPGKLVRIARLFARLPINRMNDKISLRKLATGIGSNQ
jgi:hypothetical protein